MLTQMHHSSKLKLYITLAVLSQAFLCLCGIESPESSRVIHVVWPVCACTPFSEHGRRLCMRPLKGIITTTACESDKSDPTTPCKLSLDASMRGTQQGMFTNIPVNHWSLTFRPYKKPRRKVKEGRLTLKNVPVL